MGSSAKWPCVFEIPTPRECKALPGDPGYIVHMRVRCIHISLTCIDHNSCLKERCSFISNVAKKFLHHVENSVLELPISPANPPIGLYSLILIAVCFSPLFLNPNWWESQLGRTCLHLFQSHWVLCWSQTVFVRELLEASWGICTGSLWYQSWSSIGLWHQLWLMIAVTRIPLWPQFNAPSSLSLQLQSSIPKYSSLS